MKPSHGKRQKQNLKNMKKLIVSALLALLVLPMAALAADQLTVNSGPLAGIPTTLLPQAATNVNIRIDATQGKELGLLLSGYATNTVTSAAGTSNIVFTFSKGIAGKKAKQVDNSQTWSVAVEPVQSANTVSFTNFTLNGCQYLWINYISNSSDQHITNFQVYTQVK
jgi:hypothetical protein